MSWTSYKGLGPWKFDKMWEKLHYNEGIRITDLGSPVWDMTNKEFGDTPITEHEHAPWCGCWTNQQGVITHMPYCMTLKNTVTLNAAPLNMFVLVSGKLYAFTNYGGTAHAYRIDAATMAIEATVNYTASEVREWSICPTFDVTTGRIYIMGKSSSDLVFLYKIDLTTLAVVTKVFPGTALTGGDANIYGPIVNWTMDTNGPPPGGAQDAFWTIIDADATHDTPISWTNGVSYYSATDNATNPQAVIDGENVYILTYYSATHGRNIKVDRTTGAVLGTLDYTGLTYPVLSGGVLYAVRANAWVGEVLKIAIPSFTIQNTYSFPYPYGYTARPYVSGGYLYAAATKYIAYDGMLVKLSLSSLTQQAIYENHTVEAPYTPLPYFNTPDTIWVGQDNRLYMSSQHYFILLNPTDLTFICRYDLHGATGQAADASYIYGAEYGTGKMQQYGPYATGTIYP